MATYFQDMQILPATQLDGKKAIVTGYDLIQSNYSEWFQLNDGYPKNHATYDVHK